MTALGLVVGMRPADSCISHCLPVCIQLAGMVGCVGVPSFSTILCGTHWREEDKAPIKIFQCSSSKACYTDMKGQILKSFISCEVLCEHRADCYSWSKMWGGGFNCGFGFSHTILFSFRHELAHSRCSVKVSRQALIAFEWLSTPRWRMTQGKHFLLTYINIREYLLLTEYLLNYLLDPPSHFYRTIFL